MPVDPLPFTTFGEITALGLKATVYCAGCYEHRPIDAMAGHLRDRCIATTRFRCTKIPGRSNPGSVCYVPQEGKSRVPSPRVGVTYPPEFSTGFPALTCDG